MFLNVAGGMRAEEPAADLGVAVAIASSLHDISADRCGVLIGEIGTGRRSAWSQSSGNAPAGVCKAWL